VTGTLFPGRFPVPVDVAQVGRDWRARGYSCHDFQDPPGREWKDFVHDTQELVTVVEGRLELEVEGTRVAAGPGDEVFIPKGARHTVRNVHGARTRWLFGYARSLLGYD
jgi:mannose-6-phosphate isomerase-like protein (cupin superfamily)